MLSKADRWGFIGFDRFVVLRRQAQNATADANAAPVVSQRKSSLTRMETKV